MLLFHSRWFGLEPQFLKFGHVTPPSCQCRQLHWVIETQHGVAEQCGVAKNWQMLRGWCCIAKRSTARRRNLRCQVCAMVQPLQDAPLSGSSLRARSATIEGKKPLQDAPQAALWKLLELQHLGLRASVLQNQTFGLPDVL